MSREIKENELFWARANDSVIIPSKNLENGGYDIYANFDGDSEIIFPNKTKMISTNLACAFSSKYVMILKERGSTGTIGIEQRSGVIDSGYRNLIFVPITNSTNKILIITKDEKKTRQELLEKLATQKPVDKVYITSECGDISLIHKIFFFIKQRFNIPSHRHTITIQNKKLQTIDDFILYPYSKAICQALMVEVPVLDSKEISLQELQSIPSKRGMGNLGSSGK